jgi:low temperature requirement protein LtrA
MVLYFGILFDLAALRFLGHRLTVIPVHTEHLVERVGCLTIILLGESVISLSAELADITWNSAHGVVKRKVHGEIFVFHPLDFSVNLPFESLQW